MNNMKKVLVVEDDVSIREGITDLLTLEGFQVQESENGKAALNLLMDFQPDIVISDVMMPEMDGHEFLAKYNANAELPEIPFIFLTALSDKYDMRKGMTLGADDFLTKPFNHADLLDAIHAQLKKFEHRKKQFLKETGERVAELETERELVVKELHHRVKHNLALISAFLDLGDSLDTERCLEGIKNKVFALASVHEEAYSNEKLTLVDTKKLIENILLKLDMDADIIIERELNSFELDISRAIPFGLLVFELCSLLLSKCFETGNEKKIIIRSQRLANKLRLYIIVNSTDEIDFTGKKPDAEIELLQTLLSQLNGSLSKELIVDIGTKYTLEMTL